MILRYGSAHDLHRFRSRQAGCMHPTSCLLQQRACHGGKSRCLPARRVKVTDRKAAVPSACATLDDQAPTLLVAMPVCNPNLRSLPAVRVWCHSGVPEAGSGLRMCGECVLADRNSALCLLSLGRRPAAASLSPPNAAVVQRGVVHCACIYPVNLENESQKPPAGQTWTAAQILCVSPET